MKCLTFDNLDDKSLNNVYSSLLDITNGEWYDYFIPKYTDVVEKMIQNCSKRPERNSWFTILDNITNLTKIKKKNII